MEVGAIVDHPCRLRECNYFDHMNVVTMKPSQVDVEYLTITSLENG
jgi:hypothetical protein